VKSINNEAPHYTVFSSLLLLPSSVQTYSLAPCSQTPSTCPPNPFTNFEFQQNIGNNKPNLVQMHSRIKVLTTLAQYMLSCGSEAWTVRKKKHEIIRQQKRNLWEERQTMLVLIIK